MIYKITIVHANPAAGITELYAHPRWDFPLNKDGDCELDYKTVFHVEEHADRTHEMRPTIFKRSHFNSIYIQLPDATQLSAAQVVLAEFSNGVRRTYVLKVEKKSMCEGEDMELLDGAEEVPLTTKD